MLKTTILVVCLCAGIVLAKPALDESAAEKFIVESSDEFSELFNAIVRNIFELTDEYEDIVKETKDSSSENEIANSNEELSDLFTGFYELLSFFENIGRLQEAIENVTKLADETYKFPIDEFKNEQIKIGLLKLKTVPGLLALGKDYEKWKGDNFDKVLGHENFCKFKEDVKTCTSKYNELYAAIKTSTDPDEILHYWKEWREKNLPEVMKKVKTFIVLYKKLGEKFQTSAKFAWFADYLDENFGNEMEKVIHELQPLFKELHGYVRHILHEQYGDKVSDTGLIPHHLYEQVIAQAWKPDSYVAKDFKNVKLPIENNFKESPKEVMEIASNFMKSLGLTEIPKEFWTERVKEDSKKGEECVATIFDAGSSTYLRYCNEVNIKRFLQMHGYVARIYYANERKNLPFAYSDPYNLEVATGEAVILSATTPKYLHKIGHKDVAVLPENEDLHRLYRMGIHTILKVPEYFVHVKVIADVLDNTVPVEKMNEHYWDLMKKYLGVGPPIERTAESVDFPPSFYKKIENNQQTVKFVSEVIGYQVYEALCKKSGEFVKDDKDHQLHLCNFYNSHDAGDALSHMMKLGAKKPWKEVLGTLTGDNSGMKGEAMLEYFKPLQKWLHTKNEENKITPGW